MPRHSKLTPERLAALKAAYEAWNPSDPDSGSIHDLAKQFGITSASIYYWKDRGWTRGNSARRKDARSVQPATEEQGAVLEYLTDELLKARVRIAELEDQLRSE